MQNTNEWPKVVELAKKIEKEILSGAHGKTGDSFLSLRALSSYLGVSTTTGHGIMNTLKKRGVVMICGNHHYITTGIISKDSPLYLALAKKNKNRLPSDKPLIGIHLIEIGNQFFDSLVKKCIVALEEIGYRCLIMSSSRDSNEERHILNEFINLGVSGVLSCPNFDATLSFTYNNYILPVVFFGRQLKDCNVESVIVNNTEESRRVASHLIEQGYENFAYVGLKTHPLENNEDYRRIGFINKLNESGYSINKESIFEIDIENPHKFPVLFKRFVTKVKKPLGVFCYHDLVAAEVIEICNSLGMNIPYDLGVVGFDNLPIASQLSPSLTTIAYRFDRMAQLSVDLLYIKISSDNPQNRDTVKYVNTYLKTRNSSSRKISSMSVEKYNKFHKKNSPLT